MTINPAITLGDLDPTEWDVNQPGYDGTISVSGGTGGYSNLKVTGLPAGLTPSVLSSVVNVNGTPVLSGLISITGTPTKSGVFPLVVSLTDASGATNQVADAATAKAEARVVSLTDATGATGADKYQLTINPAKVDLQVSVNGNGIVPKLATDLNLSFFFGMEQVNVPVTFGNGGPDVLKGTVMLTLYLSQNADGSGADSAVENADRGAVEPVGRCHGSGHLHGHCSVIRRHRHRLLRRGHRLGAVGHDGFQSEQ